MTSKVYARREAVNIRYFRCKYIVVFPKLNLGYFVMIGYDTIHITITNIDYTWGEALIMQYLSCKHIVVFPYFNCQHFVMVIYNAIHTTMTDKI